MLIFLERNRQEDGGQAGGRHRCALMMYCRPQALYEHPWEHGNLRKRLPLPPEDSKPCVQYSLPPDSRLGEPTPLTCPSAQEIPLLLMSPRCPHLHRALGASGVWGRGRPSREYPWLLSSLHPSLFIFAVHRKAALLPWPTLSPPAIRKWLPVRKQIWLRSCHLSVA